MVFLLASLRLQIATIRSGGNDPWPAAILIAGSLALGAWNPRAALMAFTLATPFLSGLSQSGLIACTFSASLVFSGIWIGMAANRLLPCGPRSDVPTHHGARRDHPEAGMAEDADRRAADCGSVHGLSRAGDPAPLGPSFPLLAADILIAAVSLSLAWQLWRNRESAALLKALLLQPAFGYGDPWYFLTSAFLWLQGLFFFKAQCGLWARRGAPAAGGPAQAGAAAGFMGAVFLVYGLTMAVFALAQLAFQIPKGWTVAGLQSPFEDISSFGSIAVAVFIYTVATRRAAPLLRLSAGIFGCAGLLAMVVASWSRGAWLAALVFLAFIAVSRLSKLWASTLLVFPVAASILINGASKAGVWTDQPYLARLAALVRLENPIHKDPVRLNLYKKAAAMVCQRPIAGEGIGSFYLKSVNYARSGDPYALQPDFAHNVFLQIAAELGVPVAALFAVLVALGLLRGLRAWARRNAAGSRDGNCALPVLGATLSLGAYMQTQMTANSLNVYVSNQFFFWFLLAAILALTARDTPDGASGPAGA